MTPWLVVPGPWEDKEIQHHARALAEGGMREEVPLLGCAARCCGPSLCVRPCDAARLCGRCRGPWRKGEKGIQLHPPALLPAAALNAPARALPHPPPRAGLASNCSCNCLAPKVIMLAEEWPQADAFVAAVKAELAAMPQPAAYYPGIRQRYEAFQSAYPQVQTLPACAGGW